ncbi:MAG: DUF2817 domain-containing protein [Sedimentisphaerales bacterium]|nr:DUF2817 domain-containing protein [Sedimentisphaerales bacterium]
MIAYSSLNRFNALPMMNRHADNTLPQRAIIRYHYRIRWLGLLALFFTGCVRPDPLPPAIITPVPRTEHIIGYSVQTRPIKVITLGSGEDITLFIATIHGNEWAGTPLLNELLRYLRGHNEMLGDRKIVLIPVANPDGYMLSQRGNAHGVDLNRNFPADNRIDSRRHGLQALSEPEAQALLAFIEQLQPDRIISIHQPLACIDYDGPAEALAQCMTSACDLPIRKLGAYPGSLGAYAGEELNIPIITMELHRNDHTLSRDELWRRYGPCLLAAIAFEETLAK